MRPGGGGPLDLAGRGGDNTPQDQTRPTAEGIRVRPAKPAVSPVRHALALARAGYFLAPVRLRRGPDGRKVPDYLGLSWLTLSTRTETTIRQWARRYGQDLSFLVDCGASDIVVIDLDLVPGVKDGTKMWAELGLPDSCEFAVDTPSGGQHRYWRQPDQPVPNSIEAIGPGIDVRGVGGHVYAPGSVIIGDDVGYRALGEIVPVAELPVLPDVVVSAIEGMRHREHTDDDVRHARAEVLVDQYRRRVAELREVRARRAFRIDLFVAARDGWRLVALDLLTEDQLRADLTGAIRQVWHAAPDRNDERWIADGQAKAAASPWHLLGEARVLGSAPTTDTDSWRPMDLGPYLRGEIVRPAPTVGLARDDGLRLLYPGLEHTVIAPTEAGKTWLACACVAAELQLGNPVVYVHWEETNPGDVIERLRLLAVTDNRIAAGLRFVAPERPVDPEAVAHLVEIPPSLVVHDGVNEAMAAHRLAVREEDGAAEFRRRLVRPFSSAGAAVLSCDHVVKDSERASDGLALGSIHKINGLTGAQLVLRPAEPFGRGRRGVSHVLVRKDRPGHLRRHGHPAQANPLMSYLGSLVVDATDQHVTQVRFTCPAEHAEPAPVGDSTDDEVLGAVMSLRNAGHDASLRRIRAAVRTRAAATDSAIERLVVAGRLCEHRGERGARVFTVPDDRVP